MTVNDYLKNVLNSQTLDPDGQELKALQKEREKVEKLLRKKFGYSPTIRYGGSKAKGTMIKVSYDLDIINYFHHDDTSAGKTLAEIYNNTYDALCEDYLVERKSSALRLKDKNQQSYGTDFHIDVVPGRYIDENDGDVFLYRSTGEKERLKTNLDVHIKYFTDSGVIDAIRFVKLWRVLNAVQINHFALDLLTIEILKQNKNSLLELQLLHIWEELRDNSDSLSIEDPANPTGNDLSEMLSPAVRMSLKQIADSTLRAIESSGWDVVFGSVEKMSDSDKKDSLQVIAASIARPTRPWFYG